MTKQKELLKDLKDTFSECLEIARRKNSDYAGCDDAYKNFRSVEVLGIRVETGIITRLMDKITRVSNLLDKEAKVKDEKIEDTINDAINYLAILKSYIKRVRIK